MACRMRRPSSSMPAAVVKRALRVRPCWMRSRSCAGESLRPKVWNQMTKGQPSRQRVQPQPREPVIRVPCPQRGQPRPVELAGGGGAEVVDELAAGGGAAAERLLARARAGLRGEGEEGSSAEGKEDDDRGGDEIDDEGEVDDEGERDAEEEIAEMAAARSLEIEGSSGRRGREMRVGRGGGSTKSGDSSKGRSSSEGRRVCQGLEESLLLALDALFDFEEIALERKGLFRLSMEVLRPPLAEAVRGLGES